MTAPRIHLLKTGRRIQPFDDPIEKTLINNLPLGEWQNKAFADISGVVDSFSPPCLVLPDTLWLNGLLLSAAHNPA